MLTTLPCGAANYPVTADVTFTRPGSPGTVYRVHTEPSHVFTINVPPGRYVVRVAHVVIPDVPGLGAKCPQRRTATALEGGYVGLQITCVYST
jgi:hypothetical protein